MRFDVEVKLPSGEVTRVQELNNREYLTINKYIQNADYKGLNAYFEYLILRPTLNIYDRLYLLIYYRMTFIDNDIIIDKSGKHINVSLASILDRLEENYKDLETSFIEDGIEVVLDIPTISYFDKVDELLIATIKTITYSGNCLELCDLDNEERSGILDNLPVSIFNRVTQYIETVANDLLDITVIDENQALDVQRFSINIFDNGVMQFISNIFSTNLAQFYNTIYIFQNTITPGSDIFFDLSPVESTIIMNHHSKRLKEESEQLERQQRSN